MKRLVFISSLYVIVISFSVHMMHFSVHMMHLVFIMTGNYEHFQDEESRRISPKIESLILHSPDLYIYIYIHTHSKVKEEKQ